MDEFVRENDFIGWYETSAKDNIKIDESTKSLVAQVNININFVCTFNLNSFHICFRFCSTIAK